VLSTTGVNAPLQWTNAATAFYRNAATHFREMQQRILEKCSNAF
jgi:hypothetical protein